MLGDDVQERKNAFWMWKLQMVFSSIVLLTLNFLLIGQEDWNWLCLFKGHVMSWPADIPNSSFQVVDY